METRVRGLSTSCPCRRLFEKVMSVSVSIRGVEIFHVKGFKICDVRVRVRFRGYRWTSISADTSVRIHRSLIRNDF